MDAPGRSLAPVSAGRDSPAAAAGMPLFVVADQLAEKLLTDLLEHPLSGQAARLPGFERIRLAGTEWTVVRPAAGAEVRGLLYRGLGAEDYRRLDAYWGVSEGLYRRLPVTVSVGSGSASSEETALTYLPTAKTLRRYR